MWGGENTTRDAQGKIAKGGANLQLLGAAIWGTLMLVSCVVRLQGLHGSFPWGSANGDGCFEGLQGPVIRSTMSWLADPLLPNWV